MTRPPATPPIPGDSEEASARGASSVDGYGNPVSSQQVQYAASRTTSLSDRKALERQARMLYGWGTALTWLAVFCLVGGVVAGIALVAEASSVDTSAVDSFIDSSTTSHPFVGLGVYTIASGVTGFVVLMALGFGSRVLARFAATWVSRPPGA